MDSNRVKAGHRSQQSYANTRTTGKEQYYTQPEVVDLCLSEVSKHIDLSGRLVLEPCGGTGEFIDGMRRSGVAKERIVSYDIEPRHPLVRSGDYLRTDFDEKSFVSITNPPFGRASSLAKKFFNHAADHSDYICYVVPRSWRKWSTQNSLDDRFHLISDIDLPGDCFYLPGDDETNKGVLSTIFQIWEKREDRRQKIKIPDNGLVTKIQPTKKLVQDRNGKLVKRPDQVVGANFEIVVFGHSAGRCREIDPKQVYDARTTMVYLNIPRKDVRDFLLKHDFSSYYENVAYVSALSMQEINYELNKHFNLPNFTFK